MSVTTSPWHPGERAVQRRAGELAAADANGAGIHATIPPVAAEFLAAQPMAVVAAADDHGRLWVSLVNGRPGFMRVPRPDVLAIAASLAPGDPLAAALAVERRVGVLAIDPQTRRRSRFNGRARRGADGDLLIAVDQAYSNCPKYIQRRRPLATTEHRAAGTVTTSDRLSPAQQAWLRGADTFFIGTADRDGNADASHRGGHPGFVDVISPERFRFPDYAGNSMFMTLGNLEHRPSTGFLLVDWSTGTTLQITGTATVDWDAPADESPTTRAVDVTVAEVVEIAGTSPLTWSTPEPSRFNPPVGGRPTS